MTHFSKTVNFKQSVSKKKKKYKNNNVEKYEPSKVYVIIL